jgi:hypothetical protein
VFYVSVFKICPNEKDTITSVGERDEDNDDDELKAIKQFFFNIIN